MAAGWFRIGVALGALVGVLWAQLPTHAAGPYPRPLPPHPAHIATCAPVASAGACDAGPTAQGRVHGVPSGAVAFKANVSVVTAGSGRSDRPSHGDGCSQANRGDPVVSVNAPVASCNGHGQDASGCDQATTGGSVADVNAPIGSCNRGGQDATGAGQGCSQVNAGQTIAAVNSPAASCNTPAWTPAVGAVEGCQPTADGVSAAEVDAPAGQCPALGVIADTDQDVPSLVIRAAVRLVAES